jgi:hypothetical protein
MWDDLTETTSVPQLDYSQNLSSKITRQQKIKTPSSRGRNYQIGSCASISKGGGVRSIIDDNQSFTSQSVGHTVRVDLLNDHSSDHRTSSVLRKKQLSFEYQSLRNSVENSYKSYRSKKKAPDIILTARYLQWTSWFKKRYATDPTTKLTKREFEKLWAFFHQLSSSKNEPKGLSSASSSSSNGIHLDVIVEAFVEYGVFETRIEALKLLNTIDTDRSQTITFLEFMDGINTSNVSQTLQLRYFISSLVSCRKKNSSLHEGNILGAFSNAVLRTRLRRGSTNGKLKTEGWNDLQQQEDGGDGPGSVDDTEGTSVLPSTEAKSVQSGGGVVIGSIESTPKPSSPTQYSQSHPHPLSSRLRAISSRMSNSNRVYVQDHP